VTTAPASEVDALLFDFGGVLVEIDFGRAFSSWANSSGVPVEQIASRFEFDANYAAHEVGRIGAAEYFDALRRTLGIDVSDELFVAGWNSIFVDALPGVGAVLDQAGARHPLYMFSNTNATHHEFWAQKFRALLSPFREIFVSHHIGLRKPTPEAFHAVIARLGLSHDRVAFFDDLAENVEGARSVGLRAFHVRSAEQTARVLREQLNIACAL
jgi:glucose-1-phosphatase